MKQGQIYGHKNECQIIGAWQTKHRYIGLWSQDIKDTGLYAQEIITGAR